MFVDITVRRVVAWPSRDAAGTPQLYGEPLPAPPEPQAPPRGGTAARLDVARAARRVSRLPHQLVAYAQADGYPAVVPVEVRAHEQGALALAVADGLLPRGGRRAGLLAHSYRPHLVGLTSRVFTGWLQVGDGGSARYHPFTERGFMAPPNKRLLLVSNGLLAKVGARRGQRRAALERLRGLSATASS